VEDLDRRERVVFRELTPRVEAAEKELAETLTKRRRELAKPEKSVRGSVRLRPSPD
jgi:hypothetical protein